MLIFALFFVSNVLTMSAKHEINTTKLEIIKLCDSFPLVSKAIMTIFHNRRTPEIRNVTIKNVTIRNVRR